MDDIALSSAGTVVALAIGVAFSLASKALAKTERQRITLKDEKPTSTATRGDSTNYLIGKRRVGPFIGWVGDRAKSFENVGNGVKQEVAFEAGWHILGVGPHHILHRIYQSGAIIFNGNITREEFPSGSKIDLGKEGCFYIYWGEEDQPINTRLNISPWNDLPRVGISSRWPFHCYIFWDRKRLGPQTTWPAMEYEVTRFPEHPTLTNGTSPHLGTEPWYRPGTPGSVPTFNMGPNNSQIRGRKIILFAAALRDRDIFPDVDPDHKAKFGAIFLAGSFVHIHQDGADPSELYRIEKVETGLALLDGEAVFSMSLLIDKSTPLTGISNEGTIFPQPGVNDDGVNAMHLIYMLLFSPWPEGLGVDVNKFDQSAMEQIAVLFNEANEDIYGSTVGRDGTTGSDILSNLLLDLGMYLSWDHSIGKYKFFPLRENNANIFPVPNDVIVNDPEVERDHRPNQVSRPMYVFSDRTRNYREMPIAVPDATQLGAKPQRVLMHIPTSYDVAARVAERRAQEELGRGASFNLETQKGTRNLFPGHLIAIPQSLHPLRVASVAIQQNSNLAKLKVFTDFYGVRPTSFTVPDSAAGKANLHKAPIGLIDDA
jgi:hypothetical protein